MSDVGQHTPPATPPNAVAIVGAGGAGGVLAVLLAEHGVPVTLIEARTPVTALHLDRPDQRGLALTLRSVALLKAAGLWQALAPWCQPVRRVHISRVGTFGATRLTAEEVGLEALAQVVPAHRLQAALEARLAELEASGRLSVRRPARLKALAFEATSVRCDLEDGAAVRARLVVGADGTDSRVGALAGFTADEFDYEQTALVGVIQSATPHGDTALERFTADGPVALLPLPENYRVAVVVRPTAAAGALLEAGPDAFAAHVSERMGGRLRQVRLGGGLHPWPLRRRVVATPVAPRTVLIGNAAHTIHPNGAQGLNLGLGDVAELAARLVAAQRTGDDPGSSALLDRYAAARRNDVALVTRSTHWVARGSRMGGVAGAAAYHAIFGGLAQFTPLRRAFARRASGAAFADAEFLPGAAMPPRLAGPVS